MRSARQSVPHPRGARVGRDQDAATPRAHPQMRRVDRLERVRRTHRQHRRLPRLTGVGGSEHHRPRLVRGLVPAVTDDPALVRRGERGVVGVEAAGHGPRGPARATVVGVDKSSLRGLCLRVPPTGEQSPMLGVGEGEAVEIALNTGVHRGPRETAVVGRREPVAALHAPHVAGVGEGEVVDVPARAKRLRALPEEAAAGRRQGVCRWRQAHDHDQHCHDEHKDGTNACHYPSDLRPPLHLGRRPRQAKGSTCVRPDVPGRRSSCLTRAPSSVRLP